MPSLVIYIILILFTFFSHCEGIKEKTISEIRRELLGKEVVIGGIKASGLGELPEKEVLLDWHVAEKDATGKYKPKVIDDLKEYALYELKGCRGTVVSIELVDDLYRIKEIEEEGNTYRDVIRDYTISNPYLDLTVQLPDGTLLITRGYYGSTMGSVLETAERIDRKKQEVLRNISTIIGRTIYSTGYTEVFPPHIETGEIMDTLNRYVYKSHDIQNLTPLRIIDAKYLEKDHSVLIKVQFLNGRTGIILSSLHHLNDDMAQKMSFFEKIVHPFPTRIPREFSRAEIEAIKKGSFFRGMSLTALQYSWGYPKQENDWGAAGKELIYSDRLLVYIRDKKVVDWQALSK